MQASNYRPATAAIATLIFCAAALRAVAAPPDSSALPSAANPESVGFSSQRLERLDSAMSHAVAEGKVVGMTTLLARHGKIVAVKTYGARVAGKPMMRDTMFRIYSMSKPVTGVAMMILFEEGKWRLDDPVTKFVPEFADLQVAAGVDAEGKLKLEPMKRPPTMRELMSHTSGFGYGLFGDSPADKAFMNAHILQADSLQQMIQRIATVPLLFQPGKRWSYSIGVDIQGYIVEKLSGQSLGQFVHDRIFAPLGMIDTGFVVPPEKIDRLAEIYVPDAKTGKLTVADTVFGSPINDYSKQPKVEMGGAGLVSTLDDYARFAQMLANKGQLHGTRILAPATVELMGTNVVSDQALQEPSSIGLTANIGFGLDLLTITHPREAGRLEGRGTISWEGAGGTWFWVDPTNDVIFVGMIQNFGRAGPVTGFDPVTRTLVYQALVDPAK